MRGIHIYSFLLIPANLLYFQQPFSLMKFAYMLAPLEDVSDNALRELCFKHGADLTFTEMARVSGLVRDNKSTMRKIEILNNIPTQIQLAALKENELKLFLDHFMPSKGFAGFNFNLGCPSPQIVKLGLGCAMIKRVSKVERLVRIVKEHKYNCSIKMRLGMNKYEKEKKAYLNLIKGVDADFFIVHARHGAEHYEAEPDDSVYAECVETGKNIVANGNIETFDKVKLLKDMGVKGVMVGRAAVRNPGIFEELKGLRVTDVESLKKEYIELADKYGQDKKYRENVLKRLGKQKLIDEGEKEGG